MSIVDARTVAIRRDPELSTLADLAAVLWTVRDSLELVLFKLAELRLIVSTGSARWLPRADAELRDALEGMQIVETMRAAEVDELARALECQATLHHIAEVAAEPWPDILLDHRIALYRLSTEVEMAADENRQTLSTELGERPAEAIGRRPRRSVVGDPAASASFRAALVTMSTLPQMSLQEFLA